MAADERHLVVGHVEEVLGRLTVHGADGRVEFVDRRFFEDKGLGLCFFLASHVAPSLLVARIRDCLSATRPFEQYLNENPIATDANRLESDSKRMNVVPIGG